MSTTYELTAADLVALAVLLLLTGGTLAVYGIALLAWTDRRRNERQHRDQ